MAKLLILAALREEADALYPTHSVPIRDDRRCGFSARCLTVNGHDVTIVTTGLGKVNAALAAGLYGQDADMLLMTGTCGALVAGVEAGAYWIAKTVQHDYGAAENGDFRRYRAGDWPMGDAGPLFFIAADDGALGLPHAHMASGDAFVADARLSAQMAADLGVQLVDMEVAAVGQAAHQMGKPWVAIKAVTDDANDQSGGDFHSNLCRAAAQAADAMMRWIANYRGPSTL